MKQIICYLIFFVALPAASVGQGQVFKTQREALEKAFPDSSVISRRVLFLTDKQVQEIEKLARAKVESKMVAYYVGSKADTICGYAFFASKVVRTRPATFMVLLKPNGTVRYVEILAFQEPLDYIPTAKWLDLFKAKELNDALWPSRDIHAITGATLTVRAFTQGVRNILAIYQVAIRKESEL